MKVREMIAWLGEQDLNAEVVLVDPDTGWPLLTTVDAHCQYSRLLCPSVFITADYGNDMRAS